MNRDIVGVPFNPQAVGPNRQDRSNSIQRGEGVRLDGRRPTVEESDVLQPHDSAIGFAVEGDFVQRDFFAQRFSQFILQRGQVGLFGRGS